MVRDPWTCWDGGIFPYDALAEAGISFESGMKEIQEASFCLIEKGIWTPEKRAAWDILRKAEGRLWVDLLQYPISEEEVVATLADLTNEQECVPVMPNFASLLLVDLTELERMEQDVRVLELNEIVLDRLPDFDQSVTDILAKLEFDD